MRKFLVLLLLSLISTVSLQAQKRHSGTHFSVTLPSSEWASQEMEIPGGQAISIFSLDGVELKTAIVITASPADLDAAEFIEAQRGLDDPMFSGAKYAANKNIDFKGHKAVSVDFTSKLEKDPISGNMTAFKVGDNVYFMLMYSVEANADYKSVLDSIVIKK